MATKVALTKAAIAAAYTEFCGEERAPLITAANNVGLAAWDEDMEINYTLRGDADEVYFMFACFILLHFGEEF